MNDIFFSPTTTNCNNPGSPLDNGGGGGDNGADTTNGVEMRDMSHHGSKAGTPEEMTELTEHLRRHTSRHCAIGGRDPRINIAPPTPTSPRRYSRTGYGVYREKSYK